MSEGFTLTIDGLETFAAFLALMGGVQEARIREATARLAAGTTDLDGAVQADAVTRAPRMRGLDEGMGTMAGETTEPKVLADLEAEVARDTTVKASAATLIRGFRDRLQAAVDAALANGATEAQLAPVRAEVDNLAHGTDDLAAAVAENTPGA